nr:energy-coupling factor transporter transmembrane component T [Galbitalea soli]
MTPTAGPQLIYRINPVAKMAAAFLIGLGVLLSIDWVSASVALACESVLLFWAGVPPRRLAIRLSPVLVGAVTAAFMTALYAPESGASYLNILFAHVTAGSIELATATFARILAVGVPAVVLFLTVDPTDLADGLAQVLRLPARFVIGALAAVRLVGLFIDDWRSLERARRARGVADRGRLRRLLSQAFALLVLSIRRATKLATAMEARGFGSSAPRSWARPSSLHRADVVLMLIGALIAAASITVSVATGHWRFLGT